MNMSAIKSVVIISLIIGLFFWHKYEVNTAVTKAVNAQNAYHQKQIDELTIKSLKAESELKTRVAVITGEKDAQIKILDSKYRAAIDSLRQHQERNATSNSTRNSSTAESTKGITNEGLFGRHAEISLGIARDAERLKVELISCYAQYDSVKEQLDNYRK